jgi:hypothetical protein
MYEPAAYNGRVALQLLQQPYSVGERLPNNFLVGSLTNSRAGWMKTDRVLAISLPAPAVPAETINYPMLPFIELPLA